MKARKTVMLPLPVPSTEAAKLVGALASVGILVACALVVAQWLAAN